MRKQAGVGQDKPPMGAGGVHFAWDAADKIYKASYQPFSFQSLLGDIDHKQTKFTFNVPNPFSQDKQSINYF